MNTIKKIIYSALEASGAIIKKNIRVKNKKVYRKGTIDLLTETDRAVENTVIRMISTRFPDHSILSEESKPKTGNTAYRWIIDPLDGTTNFVHAVPHIATSIACEYAGTVIAGGVFDPMREELFYAELNRGAFLNSKPIRVSPVKKLNDALLVTGFPYDRRAYADYYLSFYRSFMVCTQGVRRQGTASLDLSYVACGRLDGFWELKLHPWDVAAGALIVKEAGGTVTDFAGNPYSIYGKETLATNTVIHAAMKRIIQKTCHHNTQSGIRYPR